MDSTTPSNAPHDAPERGRSNFIRDIIDADLAAGRYQQVITRFPPEPNGYLHIGHAKSICLNFGIARDYQGTCHLRFDDTNPTKEDTEYVDAIMRDVRWLGFDWDDKLFFASDYFEKLYNIAVYLIKKGKAYVDSDTTEGIRERRGSLTEPGTPSAWRERSVEENLDLFARMRAGEFPDGAHVLRAKIDMSARNMLMRDPLLYRIRHAHHHRTGDAWCIYPLYDYAHPLSDAIESITHSVCTLEFENNREFYDWVVAEAQELLPATPHQYEFARLSLDFTMMSKRNLLKLVEEGVVNGWDDPRMPTIAGLRRKGVTPEAIRDFADMIGVAKANSQVDFGKLEYCIRNDLNRRAPRRMCVTEPLKVTLTNWPAGQVERLVLPDFPPDVALPGEREVPFSGALYIERADFMEEPPRGYHRLSPGAEVRLAYGWIIRCDEVVKDDQGEIVEVRCTCDLESRDEQQGRRRVKGVIHWVSAEHAVPCELRLYDRLFLAEQPGAERDFHDDLNPGSLRVLCGFVEPAVRADPPASRYQFTRQGYFCADSEDSRPDRLVFNLTVSLKDSWARPEAQPAPAPEAAPKAAPRDEERARPNKKTRAQLRAEIRAEDPTLAARFAAYQADLGLSEEDADVLTGEAALADLFDGAVAAYPQPASIARWVVNEVMREVKERSAADLPLTSPALARLVALVDEGAITSSAGKTLLAELIAQGGDPDAIVERLGLQRNDDADALAALVAQIVGDHPDEAARFREGKTSLLGFFVGRVMQATQGSADPKLTRQLLSERLA